MNNNLLSSALKGFMWFFGATAIHSVLRLVFVAMLARLLDPSDFGLMATAMLVVKFTEVILQMGVGPALVQKKELTSKHMDSAVAMTLIMGVGMYLLFLLANPFIEEFFNMPGLRRILDVLCLTIPLRMFSQVSFSKLQRNFQFRKLAGRDVFSYAIGYGAVGILLAQFGYGVWSLVYAALAQAALYTIVLYLASPYPLRARIYKKEVFELLNYGAGFTLASVFNYLGRNGDTFVVGKYRGDLELGFYDRAYTLMNVVNSVLGSTIGKVMFPAFSSIQNDKEKVEKTLAKSFNLCFGVIIPTSFFCFILAEDIILLLLGNKWGGAVAPFKIFCFFLAFRVSGKISSVTMKGLGFIYQHAVSQLIYMLIVILGGILVIDSGITSIAWVVGIGIFSIFFGHLLFLYFNGYKVLKTVVKGIIQALPLTLIVVASCWPVFSGDLLFGQTSLVKLAIPFLAIVIIPILLYALGFKQVVSADIPFLTQKLFSTLKKGVAKNG